MLKFLCPTDLPTRILLLTALAVGLVLSLLHAFFSVDLYRDAAGVYVPLARALAQGDFAQAFHPSIPSLNVLLSWGFSAIGMRPEQAMSLVSGWFYVGTIPVLFLLLRLFFPERWSAVGALLFACTPKIIRLSCTSLLDSGKIFFIVLALLLLYRLIETNFRSIRLGIGFGAALGGISLARSEGVGIAGVIALCAVLYWASSAIRQKKLPPILPALAAGATWALALLSRMVLLFYTTGEFIYDRRVQGALTDLWNRNVSAPVVAAVPTAPSVSWWYLFRQSLRGGYELYMIFVLIGIILLMIVSRKKASRPVLPPEIRWHNFYWVFLAVVVGNALIFKATNLAAYRYFLPDVPLLMVFTLTGLIGVWQWVAKFIPPRILVVVLFAFMLGQVINGASNFFSAKSQMRYACGKQIGKLNQGSPAPKVWFREASIEWYYSGMRRARAMETSRPDIRTFADFDYVIWNKKESGVEILLQRSDLRELPMPPKSLVRLWEKIK